MNLLFDAALPTGKCNLAISEGRPMKVLADEGKFDELQMEVGYAITHEVYTALKKAGVPDGEELEGIVADALFGIGCVLDGSAHVKGADGPMQVVLTFRRDQEDDRLLSAGGTSWIHEYAHGIAEAYFGQRRPRRTPSALSSMGRPEGRRPGLFNGIVMMVRDIAEAFTKP